MQTVYITATTNDGAKLIVSETQTNAGDEVVEAVVRSLLGQGYRVLVRFEDGKFQERR